MNSCVVLVLIPT